MTPRARTVDPATSSEAVSLEASAAPGPSADHPVGLAAEGVSLGYDGRRIIDDLSLRLPAGRITAIVGPNACGKSTLLRGLARLHPLEGGRVTLDGQDVGRMPRRELARRLGVLPQSSVAPDGVRVADLVGRGRYPHQGWFGRHSSGDDRAVAEALEATGMAELADRPIDELSGGQRQRVWIAMVLAQQPEVMLLDEPTTYLDLAHQLELLDLLTALNRERGTTIVMVLHELNLAARYADHLVVMSGGRVVAEGEPARVLDRDTVHGAFGLSAEVIDDPVSGGPLIVPIGRFHSAPPVTGRNAGSESVAS
ncbi:ABC transporter ATP-binding protein [Agromyces mediolanus]|uniref:ABC transporter ATP-binding protein n=1 Tax=Agromyces mediolanus TaxID=41986 RepID=UPI001E5CEE6E|nr:ABC transporter ATP-binding protein [Agromyces mediolanus]MCD1571821.1 ABC transporter ATP-binding protein [Agromyces mediolanus]